MDALLGLLKDYTFQIVALGSALLGIISGVLGCFVVLRKQSLLGDGISHAALPGVVLVFILTGSKNAELLLIGALFSGLMATLLILEIARHSRVKFDSALALVLSVFFGLGMVLLTYVQKIPDATQAGLNRFIFGQAATLLPRDVVLMVICGAVLMLLVGLFWKELKLFTFDSEFAQCIGFPRRKINLLLSGMVVLVIIVGLQTVGVILMSAMLIAPAVAARQWTNKLSTMVVLAAIFGGASGIAGATVSSLVSKLPTGPCIVVFISMLVLISVLLAPGRGILSRVHKRRQAKLAVKVERRGTHVSAV